jgi:hypothetical protein
MTTTSTKPSAAFWIISVLALMWNLMGVMMYIMQVTMSPETLQALPEAEQQLYTNIPMWATAAFAIAVWGSTLGCILLLLRKKLANPVFTIAYFAIMVQMVHSLFISKSIEVYGPGQAASMPIMIILIGGFLIWYSRRATAMGWLK